MLILNKKICEITEEDAKWFVEKFASKEIELLKKVTHVPFSCELLNGEKDPRELIVEDDYCMDSVIDLKLLKFEPLEKRTIGYEIYKDICFDPYFNDDKSNNKCYSVIIRLGRMSFTENGHEEEGFNVYLHIPNTKQKRIRFLGMPKINVPLYDTKEYVMMEAEYALQLDGTYANLATGHVLGM